MLLPSRSRSAGGNIERIDCLARYPVTCYEMLVSRAELDRLRADLVEASGQHGVDVAVQLEGLARRAKRLVVLDVDSTLVQDEVIELIAEEAGVAAEVAEITALAMEGEIDFEAGTAEEGCSCSPDCPWRPSRRSPPGSGSPRVLGRSFAPPNVWVTRWPR